ncbi:MAG: YcxB family protein [Oscillospiraceae bacterium]|nr:YcxB family protein [Oscillospiraceae bacterium]
MAFESISGVRINDQNANRAFVFADYFSVYEDLQNVEEIPMVFNWGDFTAIAETKNEFVLDNGVRVFNIPKSLIDDPVTLIRVRAIVEGAIAANPGIDYKFGKRILPPKNLCIGYEVPVDAYIAIGAYRENEINNSNVVLKYSGFDKLIWIFSPIVAIAAFVLQMLFFGSFAGESEGVNSNLLQILVISLFAGLAVGMSIYLFCIYGAKTLYGKILREDPAVLEEITFVVCEEGFMAAESEVYDLSSIIRWQQVAYFVETTHVYIIFTGNKAVFWLPKRLFPKELHKELGDFIEGKLLQKS